MIDSPRRSSDPHNRDATGVLPRREAGRATPMRPYDVERATAVALAGAVR
jgi:hypothetical protein